MSKRERNLAVVLVAVLGTGAILFVAYSFILSPLLEKEKLITAKQREITDLEDEIDRVLGEKRKYEAIRHQSLPNDPVQGAGIAREDYGKLLESLCRKAGVANGLNIQVSDPDNKSVPMLGSKKPAYTRLSWEVKAKGDEYHLVDFMRLFYSQPLLHQIKSMNLQRPSEVRAAQRRELDIIIKIEALVLDNAPIRPTLLPVVREVALLVGPAGYLGYNLQATQNGRGSPVVPAGVLAEQPRDYLTIAGKNIFFGPTKPPPPPPGDGPPEEDLSPFIVLTSITGHDDGGFIAVFRDLSTNNDYIITQSPKGDIAVRGEYEINGKKKFLYGGNEKTAGHMLIYGSPDGGNQRVWRVRRVNAGEVILENADKDETAEKPKPPAQAYVGGGAWAFLAVPEGKVYRVAMGRCLDVNAFETDEKSPPRHGPTLMLTREAWRAIYAPLPTVAAVSTPPVKEDRRR
jgi:hypothetical protein